MYYIFYTFLSHVFNNFIAQIIREAHLVAPIQAHQKSFPYCDFKFWASFEDKDFQAHTTSNTKIGYRLLHLFGEGRQIWILWNITRRKYLIHCNSENPNIHKWCQCKWSIVKDNLKFFASAKVNGSIIMIEGSKFQKDQTDSRTKFKVNVG
jgi:hypothetical protein